MPASSRLPSSFALLFCLSMGCATQDQHPPPLVEPDSSSQGAGAVAQSSNENTRETTGNQGRKQRPPARPHRGANQPDQAQPAAPADRLADAWVDAHNLHRARVSPAANPALPPVRWSASLASTAQAWANRCEFEHSSSGEFGENLSARTHQANPEDILSSWATEAQHFNYASNRCAAGQVCGHYTQVVWRDSTEIGCATAQCTGSGPFGNGEWTLTVCNYSPAGNWQGERPY